MQVRDGFYLLDHPPKRSQGRHPRREAAKSVICLHTAESGTDLDGPDPKAEGVARFIQRRSDPGGYHIIGDSDSIVPLLPFDWETWSDRTGSNRWAIHISIAMNAADWSTLPPERADELVRSAAWMARIAGDWLDQHGPGRPAAKYLTKKQSEARDASGFISHARRDPGRRSDPGARFPWGKFFDYYTGDNMPDTESDPYVLSIQELCDSLGFDPGPFDGLPGPRTVAAVGEMADELRRRRTDVPAPGVDDVTLRDAGLWRRYSAARAELAIVDRIAERENVK